MGLLLALLQQLLPVLRDFRRDAAEGVVRQKCAGMLHNGFPFRFLSLLENAVLAHLLQDNLGHPQVVDERRIHRPVLGIHIQMRMVWVGIVQIMPISRPAAWGRPVRSSMFWVAQTFRFRLSIWVRKPTRKAWRSQPEGNGSS